MKYKDHDLLEEAYNNITAKEEQLDSEAIEEGLWDRAKGLGRGIARGAAEAGRLAGQAVKGEWEDDKDPWSKVKTQFKGGQSSGVVQSHVQKLNANIDDFINDLKKVGKPTPQSIANFDQTATFLKGIIKKIATTSGRGTVSVSSLKSSLGKAGFLAPENQQQPQQPQA